MGIRGERTMNNNKLICFSASQGRAYSNFKKSVAKPSRLVKPVLDQIGCDQNDGLYSVWGMRYSPKNEMLWKKINRGDKALFYGHKQFIGFGDIVGRVKSKELAKHYFNDEIYHLIIILEPVTVMDVSRDKLWKLFHYSEVARVQGMMIPNLMLQRQLIREHETLDNFLNFALDLEEKVN
jgi:hypothetical protein